MNKFFQLFYDKTIQLDYFGVSLYHCTSLLSFPIFLTSELVMHVYIDVYRKQVVDRLSKQNLVKKKRKLLLFICAYCF